MTFREHAHLRSTAPARVLMGACSSRSAIAKEASDPSARPALPLSTVTAPAFVELDDLSPRVSFTITAQPPPPVSGSPPKTAPLKRKCVAFAVCSFVAQEPDELTVHAGEFVDILDDLQAPHDWCRCRRYSPSAPDRESAGGGARFL